jgi:pimeloyl-ACP methyl ester carboxylesterase
MRTLDSTLAKSSLPSAHGLDRRHFLAATAGTAFAAASISTAAAQTREQSYGLLVTHSDVDQSPFVLVPGAWHGGWVWKKVAPLLRSTGADVFSITNTGLGDRAHLATPDTDLSTHITDVVNVIESSDLSGVTLVGHSYGGMVITGVADRLHERIAHLVYLDAFLPSGVTPTSLFDLAPGAEAAATRLANEFGAGWKIPPTLTGDPPTFDVTDPQDIAWLTSHLAPQPLKTFSEKLHLSTPLEARSFTRTYILASTEGGPFPPMYTTIKDNAAWRTFLLPTAHDAMVTQPLELAQLLWNVRDVRDVVSTG